MVSTFVQRADVFQLPTSEDGQSLLGTMIFVVIPQRAGADIIITYWAKEAAKWLS